MDGTPPVNDTLRSLVSNMGDPGLDKAAAGAMIYQHNFLTDGQLLSAYSNSWIPRKIVDIPAMDALRKGREWQLESEDAAKVEAEEKRLGLWPKLLKAKTWARLWGGAAIFMSVKGQDDLEEPLDVDRIGLGDVQYLTVMNRRELNAAELDRDPLSEFYGTPEYYQVSASRSTLHIHPSRFAAFIGDPHPDPLHAEGVTLGWGFSSLQSVFTAVKHADSSSANIASLIFEANVDVFGIPGLMEHLSTPEYREKLLERLVLADTGKSISKSLMRDSEEEYDRHPAQFQGLSDLMQSFLLIVSGAADIPLTRFLGQSPAGLSSTGEGDMKNYYDRINSVQTLEIQPAIARLDAAIVRSALGTREDVLYDWAPLEQLSEQDRAEQNVKNADAAERYARSGLFLPDELREVVGSQLVEQRHYPGLGKLLKENGELPELDLGEEQEPSPGPGTQQDARPRTLYVSRRVTNAEQILAHYRAQGVPELYAAESLHVTVVYSKRPVDWMKMGQPWEAELEVSEGGPRQHELFGDLNDVLVLLFTSPELEWRSERARDIGALYEHGEYQPHISLSLRGADIEDIDALEPWTGPVVLGPEEFEEIDTDVDWRSKVETE